MRTRLASSVFLLLALGCGTSAPAGKPDASVPGVPPIDLSAWNGAASDELLRFLGEVSRAQHGQSADLDGDGLRELTVLKFPDGRIRWVLEGDGRHAAAIVEAFADGHRTYTIYFENNGNPLQVSTYDPDGGVVHLYDDDFNRVFDRRRTETPQGDGGLLVVEEVLTDAGFAETDRFGIPVSADQGAGSGCDGTSNMPVEVGLFTENSPGITLLSEGKAACDLKRASKVGKALGCAREQLKCLDRTNAPMANKLRAHLATDGLVIGCNNACGGRVDATTQARIGDISGKMNWNPNTLDSATDDDLCALMLHELTHYAGFERDSHHDDGVDQVYSCARYCGHCSSRGPATPAPTKNQDCAECAFSETVRRTCGVKSTLQDLSCPPAYTLCHGGIGVNSACETCEGLKEKDCKDRSFSGMGVFSCCKTCPATAMRVNDKPCPGPLMGSDTCSKKPPECP